MRFSNPKIAFVILLTLFLSVFFLVSGYYVYPAPGGDSLFYTQPGLNVAAGKGLSIPLFNDEWGMDNLIDRTGARRYLHFPPLYPLSLAYLMGSPSPQNAFIVIAVIDILVIVLSFFILYKAATRQGPLTWLSALLLAAGLFGIASTLDQEGGRPEILARLIFTLSLAVILFYKDKKYSPILLAVLLGLMGATHPFGGLMLGFLLAMFFSARYGHKKALLHICGSAAVSLLVFFAVIKLGPHSITETLTAMRTMGKIVHEYLVQNEALNPKIFFTHYVLDPGAPFLLLIVLLAFFGAFFAGAKHKKQIQSPVLFWGVGLVFTLLLAWLIFYIGGHQFYVTIFSPLLFGIIVYYVVSTGKKSILIITLLFILPSTLGIARNIFMFPMFLQRGVKLEEVRLEFQRAQARYGPSARFGVTGSFWTLSEDYTQMYTHDINIAKGAREDTTAIFWQQAYSGRQTPPEIEGCRLIKDTFGPPPRFFGLKAGSSLRDYAYAFYECNLPHS